MLKSKLPAIIAILVSVGGLLTHPEILGLLPEKIALSLSALGIVLQAISKGLLGEK